MNVTDISRNDTCDKDDECSIEISAAGFITLAEGTLTLILNVIVVVLLARKKKKTNIVLLFLHLAIADIAVAVLYDVLRTLQQLTDWTYGGVPCVAFLYSQQVALFASTFILLSLCYDRLLAIWRPLWPGRSDRRNRWGMILFPWLFAALFSIPYFKSGVITWCGKIWCTPLFRGNYGGIYLPIQMTLMTFIPSVVLVAVYGYIAYLIRIGTRKTYVNKGVTKNSRTCSVTSNQIQSRIKAERRSIVVAVVVGLAFIICWMPYSFSIIYNMFHKTFCNFYILNALAPLNSLINPILVLTLNYKMFVENDQRGNFSGKNITCDTRLTPSKSTSKSSVSTGR